ncbi:MAG: DUF1330 domain-containing protein [Deltaproteobacteria bacterium]|nr:DUF1330 domain-containing protein [Deltaproteobacteria bacterium]
MSDTPVAGNRPGGGDNHPTLEISLGSRGYLGITGTSAETRLDRPLYAINLLDRRRPWAYELYGALAVRPLGRAGGRVLFKGHRTRMLEGDPSTDRETLLLVRYPEAQAFLGLVQRPIFMALGLLRQLGLKRFLFGFAERLGSGPTRGPEPHPSPRPYRGAERYLLYAFTADREQARPRLEALTATLENTSAKLYFAGLQAATVTHRSPNSETRRPSTVAPPMPWSGIVVLSAADEAALESAYAGPPLAELRALADSSAATFYRRTV